MGLNNLDKLINIYLYSINFTGILIVKIIGINVTGPISVTGYPTDTVAYPWFIIHILRVYFNLVLKEYFLLNEEKTILAINLI